MYENSSKAESAQIQLEKDLQEASRAYGVVAQWMNEIRRKIMEMDIKRHDLSEIARKGRENIRRIESEIRIAKTEYWRLKNEGL